MLNTILSAVILLSVLSCATQKNGTSAKSDTSEVNLNVTITSNYCGGVAPSDEMVEKLKTPKKFSNQNFYISTKEGLEESMQEVKTTASGNLTTSLKKGTYYVFLPQKISAKHSSNDRTEKGCNDWKNTPNGTFVVGDDSDISFNIHKTCDACGPMRM